MIGRSLVIFQLGNNQNEIHQVNSWEMCLSSRTENFKEKVAALRKEKQWKPEEIVSDREVEKICHADNCIDPKEPGYHRWAADGITVINISDDPNLPNPMTAIIEERERSHKKRAEGFRKLKDYIPELTVLRKAVPESMAEVEIVLPPLKVQVKSSVFSPICVTNYLGEDKKNKHHIWELVDRATLESKPEIQALINCPFRKAYKDRCKEVGDLLGLSDTDVENEVYTSTLKKE